MENFMQLLNSMQPIHSANAVIKVQLPEQYTDNTVPLDYSHQILHKEKNGENIEIPLQDFEVNPFISFGIGGDEGLPLGLKLEYPKALQKTDFKKSDDVIQINNCNNYIKWQRTPEDWYFDENGNGIIPTQGIQYNHDSDSLTFIAVYKNNKFLYVGALLKMPYAAGGNTDNIQICIPAETLFTSTKDKTPIKIDSNNKSWNDVFPLSLMLMLMFTGVEENERNDNIIKYDLPNMSSNKDLLYAYMRSTTKADGDKYRVDKETFLNEYFQKLYSSYLALIDSGLSPEEATREFVSELGVSTDNCPNLTNYDDFVEYISNLLVESESEGLQEIRLYSELLPNLFVNSMLYADTTQMCDKSKIHIPNYDSLFSDTYDDYDYENTGTQTPIEEDKSEYTFYPLYYNEIDFTKLEVPYYYQILTGGDYFNYTSIQAYLNKHKNEGEEIEPSFSLLLNWAKEALTFPLSKYDFFNIVTQIFRSSQSSLEDNDTILIQYTDEHEDIQYIDNKFIQGLESFHYKDEPTKQADYYFTECELQGSDDLPIPDVGTLPHKKIIDIQPFFEITESIIEELQNASEIENDQILYKSSTSHMDEKEYTFTIDQSKFAQDIKTITFSSNSLIKFDQEVLNVNKRDGCAYELSYSYGALSNGTQYIKLLFDGYSHYSAHTNDVKLRYVVFRLTDGRIILFMKTKPTNSNYMGTYSFNGTTFTASTSQPTILGPTGIITYDEPQYIVWSGIKYVPEGVSSVLMTPQDQYVLKINDNNILTFNYEDCLERVSEEGAIELTYINEEFQEYLLSIQQLNDSTEASNIPFPENGLCILIMNNEYLTIGLIGSVNKITQNDTVIIERSIRNIIVSNPKIAPYYANEKHGEIFNDYNYNRADGKYSHAEGYYNTIYSNAHYSHIEGNNNIIFGVNSHCEGAKNRSIGNYSHVEGYGTTANGDYSHVEGYGTTADGINVHTEGNNTTASGDASHAEGHRTTASGETSHAEGSQTKASSKYSHAEGYKTTASGMASHAECDNTTASGEDSHAEGYNTTASGIASHAEGFSSNKATALISNLSAKTSVSTIIEAWKKKRFSLAFGKNSSCSGLDCLALKDNSHAEGNNTTASGYNSHAEGNNTTASGDCSHAEGSSSNKATNVVSNLVANTANNTIIEAWKSNKFSLALRSNSSCSGLDCLALADCSHAEGKYTTASGNCSHAECDGTTASGFASHAEGSQTTASKGYSHAEGYSTTASEECSHAEGYRTKASSKYSHAEGDQTTASGWRSHAEGNYTTASSSSSHAEGKYTTASGDYSHAEGYSTTASEECSHAEGNSTTASNYASHASGKYNVSMTTGGSDSNTTGTAFVIGNGFYNLDTGSSALSNAFSVQYDGTVKAQSTITASTTADYAEFFEWLDGNPDNEDRVGYFVALDGDKIKIASNENDYILGVISGEPFVLGNGDCDTWNEMYLHDEFRRTIYEPAPKVKEVLDEEGHPTGEYEVVEGEYEGTRPVLNPKYDPSKVYISRFKRKEWSPVGMLGVLAVRHDGTAKVNGYVTVNKDGIATACDRKSENSYRVIKSKTDNVVEIIFR